MFNPMLCQLCNCFAVESDPQDADKAHTAATAVRKRYMASYADDDDDDDGIPGTPPDE